MGLVGGAALGSLVGLVQALRVDFRSGAAPFFFGLMMGFLGGGTIGAIRLSSLRRLRPRHWTLLGVGLGVLASIVVAAQYVWPVMFALLGDVEYGPAGAYVVGCLGTLVLFALTGGALGYGVGYVARRRGMTT